MKEETKKRINKILRGIGIFSGSSGKGGGIGFVHPGGGSFSKK